MVPDNMNKHQEEIMRFQDYLAQMPSVHHLQGLEVQDEQGKVIHVIPAIEGKLGSLKLYYALTKQFSGCLNKESAQQGLIWFAEHVEDAKKFPNKHPNIDLLLCVEKNDLVYQLVPVEKILA